MNWHTRYAQQANWTRALRKYVFGKVGLQNAHNVLEVGCGTGAILAELSEKPQKYGLDINLDSLAACRIHAPHTSLVQGNAVHLPFAAATFRIVYSHFLLLWVQDPLQALLEMKRVTQKGGYVIAFAEPNYLERVDEPKELVPLGRWQTASLVRQGADPALGARLAELFFKAGISIVETGTIQDRASELSIEEWDIEWQVIESDLHGWIPEADLQEMKQFDKRARENKTRVLHVPTHFVWGRV
jgi:ubiquinone/menaquinone biosynthesis C-methylase UbiE